MSVEQPDPADPDPPSLLGMIEELGRGISLELDPAEIERIAEEVRHIRAAIAGLGTIERETPIASPG